MSKLKAVLLAFGLCLFHAAPAQAACFLWFCWDDPDPVLQPTVETVPFTGTTHVVQLVGNGAFPEEVFATNGDRILFVNMHSSTNGVKATNSSWNSGDMGYKSGFLLLVQPGVQTNYKSIKSNSSGLTGSFRRAALPGEVNYPAGKTPLPTLLGLLSLPTSLVTNLVSGLLGPNAVTGLVGGLLGGGNGNGN